MRSAWLLRDGDVLASAEVVEGVVDSVRCLVGRQHLEGAVVARGAAVAHTAGAKVAVDAAFLDAEMVVLATVRLEPWRVARPRRGARAVVHAPLGSFERWRLVPGDRLELRETR